MGMWIEILLAIADMGLRKVILRVGMWIEILQAATKAEATAGHPPCGDVD